MLSFALKHLFPDINFQRDCLLQDVGNGPYIAKWNRQETQPTQAQIDAAIPAAQAALNADVADRAAFDTDRAALRVGYVNAMTNLNNIIATSGNMSASVATSSIQELARDMRFLLKALRRTI